MNVLVLNAGSSSVKFQLVRTDAERIAGDTDQRLARGIVERIGGEAIYSFRVEDGPARKGTAPLRDHRAAIDLILQWMAGEDSGVPISGLADIHAAGHRVAHGGERLTRSTRIDDGVLRAIEEMIDLAPLHNPHNLKGVQAVRAVLGPGLPQVAVFDTAFHHSLPERAYLYAIPYSFYRRYKIRRYGFHGTSHRYIAHRYRQLTGRSRQDTKIITLHLGNGASACAIREGRSVDTSMGFTPLEGLVMGTRTGDVDAAVLDYIATKEGLSAAEVESLFNKQSGLLGISGLTNDMRELLAEAEEHDDRRAWLAIELFCYRIRKYVGAYMAVLGGADAIVFAGGIGENAAPVRTRVCQELEWLGLDLSAARNAEMTGGREGLISTDASRLQAWVIPTDEELLIARDTYRVIEGIEWRY
jgi:acetate kinase